LVRIGRKNTTASPDEYAIATGLAVGNNATVVAAGPMLGAEQIEQEWWSVWELIECEWTACTVPMANTSPTHRTHNARAIGLRSWIPLIMDLSIESSAGLGERPANRRHNPSTIAAILNARNTTVAPRFRRRAT
jgi:hypothetical protein